MADMDLKNTFTEKMTVIFIESTMDSSTPQKNAPPFSYKNKKRSFSKIGPKVRFLVCGQFFDFFEKIDFLPSHSPWFLKSRPKFRGDFSIEKCIELY